jgi:hypothetical protein
VTDFGGPNPVGGPDSVDPGADRWRPGASSPALRPAQQQPSTQTWQPQGQSSSGGYGAAPPAVGALCPPPAGRIPGNLREGSRTRIE